MGIEKNLFVKPPSQILFCPRCCKIYDNCVETKDEKCCFTCVKQNEKELKNAENINQVIRTLEVYCKNKKLNCQWIGKYYELKNHLTTCAYKPTKCSNQPFCTWFGSTFALENHLKTCYYNKCDKCDRIIQESVKVEEIKKIKLENENFKELFQNLNSEIEFYKTENRLLQKENEKEHSRNKELNQQMDLLEITFQEKIQSLLQEKDISLMNEFVNENFDLLREQFVEDNIRLNQEIRELKKKNDEILNENLKIKKETTENLESFREKVIELEKENLILKTNENYKELSKKLITKCDLLNEQNVLLRDDIKNSIFELLTKDSILKISTGVSLPSFLVVQLLNKFQKFVSNQDEKYRVLISDGIHCHPAIIEDENSILISSEKLTPFSIILIKCIKTQKNDILIIKDIQILNSKCDWLIGNPIRLDSKSFIWKISKNQIINNFLSPVFTIKGFEWQLQISSSKKQFGLFLISKNKKILKTEFNFMILEPNGNNHFRGAGTKLFTFEKDDQSKDAGWNNFIKKSDLESYFEDDLISICVGITQIQEIGK
eukprot:gene5446-9259_t